MSLRVLSYNFHSHQWPLVWLDPCRSGSKNEKGGSFQLHVGLYIGLRAWLTWVEDGVGLCVGDGMHHDMGEIPVSFIGYVVGLLSGPLPWSAPAAGPRAAQTLRVNYSLCFIVCISSSPARTSWEGKSSWSGKVSIALQDQPSDPPPIRWGCCCNGIKKGRLDQRTGLHRLLKRPIPNFQKVKFVNINRNLIGRNCPQVTTYAVSENLGNDHFNAKWSKHTSQTCGHIPPIFIWNPCHHDQSSWTSKGYSRCQSDSAVRLAGDCNPWMSKMWSMRSRA
jgi:hypothetical protein